MVVKMRFEIYRDGVGLMGTSSIEAIPNKSQLLDMQRSGYKFKINGKVSNVSQVCEFVKNSKIGDDN